MSLSITTITFDCRDASVLSRFWSAALHRPIDDEPPANEFFASIGRSEPSVGLFFIAVPEGREVKNRVHLDLDADDREAEVKRLVELGATVVHDKDEWGVRWTTLIDPEGNEFCVATH